MGNIPYFDILILAMIAVFILNRLRGVLGKKTGNEEDIVSKLKLSKEKLESSPDEIITEKARLTTNKTINYKENVSINNELNNLKKLDKSFDLVEFIDGAKNAFEYILKSYSSDDYNSLKNFLSSSLLKEYKKEIDLRKKNKTKLEITIIGIKEPMIKNVKILDNKEALLSVQFESEQIQVSKDLNGKIIDGDDNQILTIQETWSFSKKLNTKSRIWILDEILES